MDVLIGPLTRLNYSSQFLLLFPLTAASRFLSPPWRTRKFDENEISFLKYKHPSRVILKNRLTKEQIFDAIKKRGRKIC